MVRICLNEHDHFSGDPDGHFNPKTLDIPFRFDSFPLNIFLRQLEQSDKIYKKIKKITIISY